jgi:hypothetical protein
MNNEDTPMSDLPNLDGLTEQQLMDLLAAKRQHKEQNRKAYLSLAAESVPKAVSRLLEASQELSDAKRYVFDLVRSILALKYEVYETSADQKNGQQSHTFSTDHYSITVGYRIIEAWDDTAKDGIQKVKAYLGTLAKDQNSAVLVETIFRLLKQDKNGNLRASRILELQKIANEFNDAEFSDGVKTIADAYKPRRSCWFVEAHQFNGLGEKTPIPLSISAVDFPDGFEFDLAGPVGAVCPSTSLRNAVDEMEAENGASNP